jgi:hypothetical protein
MPRQSPADSTDAWQQEGLSVTRLRAQWACSKGRPCGDALGAVNSSRAVDWRKAACCCDCRKHHLPVRIGSRTTAPRIETGPMPRRSKSRPTHRRMGSAAPAARRRGASWWFQCVELAVHRGGEGLVGQLSSTTARQASGRCNSLDNLLGRRLYDLYPFCRRPYPGALRAIFDRHHFVLQL